MQLNEKGHFCHQGENPSCHKLPDQNNFTRLLFLPCGNLKKNQTNQLVLGLRTSDNSHKIEMQSSLFVATRLFSAVSFECSELTLPEIIFIAVICRFATTEVTWDDSDISDQVKITLNAETCECTVVL